MKKSFILHLDSLAVLDELSPEQAGVLFLAIRNYNLGIETDLDFGLRMAFLPFKHQFDRDAEKYQSIVDRNRKNAIKGGRPKKPKETQKNPVGLFGSEMQPENLDNENESVNVNNKNTFDAFWNAFDKKVDRNKCMKAWDKIKPVLHQEIISKALLYASNTPDSKYRKNPLTWLNGKCWEDEVVNEKVELKKYIPTI